MLYPPEPARSHDEILDRTEEWHDLSTDVWYMMGRPELHDYLGWTEAQYYTWFDTGNIPELEAEYDCD